jgi:hypothetical protein
VETDISVYFVPNICDGLHMTAVQNDKDNTQF